jgi:hypothetical protein
MFDKKFIGLILTFAAGQGVQLLILNLCLSITYSSNVFIFCLVAGIITIVLLMAGAFFLLISSFSDAGEHEEDIGARPHKSYDELKAEAMLNAAKDDADEDDFSDVIATIFTAEETANV